jgi:hypothetical protein
VLRRDKLLFQSDSNANPKFDQQKPPLLLLDIKKNEKQIFNSVQFNSIQPKRLP